MSSEILEELCDVSYELVIKMVSAVEVMNLKVMLEIRQLLPPFHEKVLNFFKKFPKSVDGLEPGSKHSFKVNKVPK